MAKYRGTPRCHHHTDELGQVDSSCAALAMTFGAAQEPTAQVRPTSAATVSTVSTNQTASTRGGYAPAEVCGPCNQSQFFQVRHDVLEQWRAIKSRPDA